MSAKVLVVDDDLVSRDLVRTVLGYRGYSMRSAASGQEALAVMAEEVPDLVLIDLIMPKMNGYALVRAMRADPSLADVRVVFYTSHFLTDLVRAEAGDLEVGQIVEKSGDLDALIAAVAVTLAA